MKVIIYTRQSKHRDESVSHELQENACQSFAKSKGWDVVRVLHEKGVSGKTISKRKEFQTAVKMIKDKEAEGLLVWRWSRFARNTLEGLITLKTIEDEAKGQVHCALEQIDRSAMGKFSLTMMLGMAELESNVKGEQWREALMRRLHSGLPPSGKNQFGYDKVNGSYVQNTDAEILREAYRRYTAGQGARTICEDFSARGLAAAGSNGWAPRGFFDLLDKSFYAGKISYEGQDFPGAHEPILTAAQWAAYRKARESRKLQEKPRNPKWMLAGLVECGICGGKMVSHMARGVPNLMCATYNAKGKAGCKGIFRKRSQIQTAVWYWLGSHYEEWAAAMPTDEEGQLAAEKAVADAEAAKDAAQATYSRYQKYAFVNNILPEVSKDTLAEYSAAIDQAQAVLNDAQAELGNFTPASDIHEQISQGALLMGFSGERPKMVELEDGEWEDAAEDISEASTAQFREVLSKIIEKVIVLPATGKSARDPDRDHRAEVKIVPRRV
jgi:site-specific DNA recombinase